MIDSGSAEYINQKEKNHIASGSTVMINPNEIHSCNPDKGDWSYRMLFIDAIWIGKLQSEMLVKGNTDYQIFSKKLETTQDYYQHFHVLFEGLSKETNSLITESLLIEFFEYCFIRQKKLVRKPAKSNKQSLSRVNEKLLGELEVNHSLNDLSIESGISRYHLIRSFKQIYGLSPHALQLDARIKKAKKLLKLGHSISDISTILGFSDQSHFQRNFKKRLALTPRQYQAFFI